MLKRKRREKEREGKGETLSRIRTYGHLWAMGATNIGVTSKQVREFISEISEINSNNIDL